MEAGMKNETTQPRSCATCLAAFAAIALIAVCLAGCSGTGNGQGASGLQQKPYPYVMLGDDDDSGDKQLNLYFVGDGDVPYVAISEFMPLFGGMHKDESIGIPAAEYSIEQKGAVTTVARKDNGSQMTLDASADTIGFSNLDLFVQSPGDVSLNSLIPVGASGTGGVSNLFKPDGEVYDRNGNPVELDLAAYSIDIIESGGECYLPLQTAGDLLIGRLEGRVVFNGETVFILGDEAEDLQDIYSAPTGQMSEEFAAFNYNELRFLLDTFYGLKAQHDISDFDTVFEQTGLKEGLTSTDPTQFDAALQKFISVYIDDLHSSFQNPSYLSGIGGTADETQAQPDLESLLTGEPLTTGESTLKISLDQIAYYTYRAKAYPDLEQAGIGGVFLYEEVDDTAVITFDAFTAAKDDYYNDADLDKPQDTIELIAAVHRNITRDGSPIKNVVIDLSNNGGGQTDAAAFFIAWCKGPTQLALRDVLTGAQSVASYRADVNLDGAFDKNDILPMDIKVYCLTSPASFSCGNLVPAVFKGSPRITLLGRASGGGTCAVLPCSTASGALFSLSGCKQLSTVKNGSFYDIDRGIEPDFGIDKIETFYDRSQLAEYIHMLR